MSKPKPIVEQLRAAIAEAEKQGESLRSIASRCEVNVGQLSRLMAGERSPQLDTAERIAKGLGYAITLKALK